MESEGGLRMVGHGERNLRRHPGGGLEEGGGGGGARTGLKNGPGRQTNRIWKGDLLERDL